MKTRLTKVSISDKDKEGKPLTGKYGPFLRVAIQTTTHADKWLSGITKGGSAVSRWEEGQEVEIEVIESDKKDKNGLPYLNFKVPSKFVSPEEFKALELRVEALENAAVAPKSTVNDEIDVDGIPF